MTKKVEYGILIRTKNIYMVNEIKCIKFYADIITFGDDGKPRNCNEYTSNKDYKFYDGLGINCFIDAGDEKIYGVHIEYENIYGVNQNIAHKMYKTLKKINNKLEKFNDEFGQWKTFGELVSRFAKTIGAKTIVFYEDYNNIHSNYTKNNFKHYKPGQAVNIIDMWIDCILKDVDYNY